MFVLVVQIVFVVLHANKWSENLLETDSLLARLLGFKEIVQITCMPNQMARLSYRLKPGISPVGLLSPLFRMLCYFIMATVERYLWVNHKTFKKMRPTVVVHPADAHIRKSCIVWSTADIWWTALSIFVYDLVSGTGISIYDQFLNCCAHMLDLIMQNCYILNNAVMMVWSIVYHGWLTFVFLLWANALWVIPNQRRNMMICTPFVAVYAELLLIVQYLYTLDFSGTAIAETLQRHASHMGILRNEYPVQDIMLQTLFTCCFWLSLRQHIFETRVEQAGNEEPSIVDKRKQLSNWAKNLASTLCAFLLQLWMWVLMGFLLVMATSSTDRRVTAMHIIYMMLFLVFLITFHVRQRWHLAIVVVLYVYHRFFRRCLLPCGRELCTRIGS